MSPNGKPKSLHAYLLPGTIQLPSRSSLGLLVVEQMTVEVAPGKQETVEVVHVMEKVDEMKTVHRSVLLKFVSAIHLPDEQDEGQWFFPPVMQRLAKSAKTPLGIGIVFVPQDAPVSMTVEFGVTAIESSEYLMAPGCDCCKSYSYAEVAGEELDTGLETGTPLQAL